MGGHGATPTVTGLPHLGHLIVLPADLSEARSLALQDEQATMSGMMASIETASASHIGTLPKLIT
jgi:hypothetical protein